MPADKLYVDHVYTIGGGASNANENIQPLCRACHEAKVQRPLDYRDPAVAVRLLARYRGEAYAIEWAVRCGLRDVELAYFAAFLAKAGIANGLLSFSPEGI